MRTMSVCNDNYVCGRCATQGGIGTTPAKKINISVSETGISSVCLFGQLMRFPFVAHPLPCINITSNENHEMSHNGRGEMNFHDY